jgi:hypothetical protein
LSAENQYLIDCGPPDRILRWFDDLVVLREDEEKGGVHSLALWKTCPSPSFIPYNFAFLLHT